MRRLLNADVATVYASGHLFFIRQATLFAQKFDPDRLELQGNPFSITERVDSDVAMGNGSVSMSATHTLVYRTAAGLDERQLVWFDRSGKEIRRVSDPDSAAPLNPELSSDGRRVAVRRTVNGNFDIWLVDTLRGVLSRFTSEEAIEDYPIWSPDGTQIVYQSNRNGPRDLYLKATSGEATELLLASPNYKSPTDWSSDGEAEDAAGQIRDQAGTQADESSRTPGTRPGRSCAQPRPRRSAPSSRPGRSMRRSCRRQPCTGMHRRLRPASVPRQMTMRMPRGPRPTGMRSLSGRTPRATPTGRYSTSWPCYGRR